MKHPLSGALVQMQTYLREFVDGAAASGEAPLPDDPEVITRHIKETAYFLRADLVGVQVASVCRLQPRHA
jgi:hypothetical protein